MKAQSIYVMRSDGRVKVGISSSPGRRRSALSTASHTPVECVYEKELPKGAAAITEAAVHELLEPLRLNGEWFLCQAATAIHAIEAVTGGDTTLDQARSLVTFETAGNMTPNEWLALRAQVRTFLREAPGDFYWL